MDVLINLIMVINSLYIYRERETEYAYIYIHHITHIKYIQFLKLIYFLLKDNYYTEFCCFLSNLNMNQLFVNYISIKLEK